MTLKRATASALVYFGVLVFAAIMLGAATPPPTEAPAGVDNKTADPVTATQAQHNADLETFSEVDTIEEGLGPTFNNVSCVSCHNQPVVGGISQIQELRAGSINNGVFTPATVVINQFGVGGPRTIAERSLINQQATCPAVIVDDNGATTFNFPNTDAHERVGTGSNDNIRAQRTSLNILGDGFVEVIADSTLLGITATQKATPAGSVGTPFHPDSFAGINLSAGENTVVDLLERPGMTRVGRFGWKAQLASLVSFSGGAYLNEMGITNRIIPEDVTDLCDVADDPEDDEDDVTIFARFMRTTKPQSRDAARAATSDAQAGSVIFDQIGCNFCHVRNITTAPAGTVLRGVDNNFTPGVDLVVSAALGNKIIHPFSDFALHTVHPDNIGDTQANGKAIPFAKTRTPPLWGVRFRNEMMHDGIAETFTEAILAHEFEADFAEKNFIALSQSAKDKLIAFLRSL